MAYNVLDNTGSITISKNCIQDSNVGYEANFTANGDVNGWTYYNGIHTYGCWNGYLFGTLYEPKTIIGKATGFLPIDAESFYTVRITMKFSWAQRMSGQVLPKFGRVAWRTITNSVWDEDKELDFPLYQDDDWHTYVINMAEAQWWQGSIADLRIFPTTADGKAGDQFFIKIIEVISTNTYKCLNTACSYYSNYIHNCPGVGERGFCKSKELDLLYSKGARFTYSVDNLFTITENVNDVLLININDYGYEKINLPPIQNITGKKLAGLIQKELSKVDVGGYAECEVSYTDRGSFIIYSGTYHDDSKVLLLHTKLAEELNFFKSSKEIIYTQAQGTTPATGFDALSSFKIKNAQLSSILDSSDTSEFLFNPSAYSVEVGRSDWLATGLGQSLSTAGAEGSGGQLTRTYTYIEGKNSVIIDFNHPANASGRITKIYAAITLDQGTATGIHDADRIANQLSNATIMFFRPRKDGTFYTLPFELAITNRAQTSGKIYAKTQEYIEVACDIFLNKGDLIGIYNANVYKGMSITGAETDSTYFKLGYKPSLGDTVEMPLPDGQGSAGLLLYGRSDILQKRLVLDVDLGNRINISDVSLSARTLDETLEYNIAACLDAEWKVNLFDGNWTDGYVYSTRPLVIYYYNHPSIAYGVGCLSDGIKIVPDGLAADTFSVNYITDYDNYYEALGKKDGGKGVVLNNPKYFSVNGDQEWLGNYALTTKTCFSSNDFYEDPIAFTIDFPQGFEKSIHKSVIYFKEKANFRSFSLSTYKGPYALDGTSDDPRYDLLPNRDDYATPWTSITLDGLIYTPENENLWSNIDLYLAKNPCIGRAISTATAFIPGDTDSLLGIDNNVQYREILNMEQYMQAVSIDWNTLEHRWSSISTKGFRIYCDQHLSTKICEMELYCIVDNPISDIACSLDVLYSDYGDYWYTAKNLSTASESKAFIGDTPKKLQITLRPTSSIYISTISFNLAYEDVYIGEKGCDNLILPSETQIGVEIENAIQKLELKNTYGQSYDLYVDIPLDIAADRSTIFYSTLNNFESITSPQIGPDAYVKKQENYMLRNINHNVAINCPTYKLKNLADGAKAWYSHDDGGNWTYWGEVDEAINVNFNNLASSTITIIDLPTVVRSKWWKIGFLDPRVSTKVREIKAYYDGNLLENVKYYHHKNQDVYTGGNFDTAPHLINTIIDGSYYILTGNQYIGIELPNIGLISRLIIYHDALVEIENSYNIGGIDVATALCVKGNGLQYQTDSICDYSYYEHTVEVVGNDIYCDSGNTSSSFSFNEDFIGCDLPSDWLEVKNYSYNSIYSTYSCITGVCPTVSGGYARSYSMWCGDSSKDGTYKFPQITTPQTYFFDEKFAFNLKFVLKAESFLYNGTYSEPNGGVAVGILGPRTLDYGYGWFYSNCTTGASVGIRYGSVAIVIKDLYNNYSTSAYVTLDTRSAPNYYELTSDGKGNYHLNVWSDNFNGLSKLVNLDFYSPLKWEADKVGIGSGNGTYTNYNYLCSGWIGDIRFTSVKSDRNKIFDASSVRFNGNQNSYLKVGYNNSNICNLARNNFDFKNNPYCIDFWMKPSALPTAVGQRFWIAGSWNLNQPLTGAITYPSSWILYVERTSTTYNWCFKYNNGGVVTTLFECPYFPEINRWHHYYIGLGTEYYAASAPNKYAYFLVDGYTKITSTYTGVIATTVVTSLADVVIGKGFNGFIDELRISSDAYTYRIYTYISAVDSPNFDMLVKEVPTNPYERYYTFSVYDSSDNVTYGKTMNVDVVFDNTYSYHLSDSQWSKGYYTYFALDLGQRHDLDLMRSFPVDTAFKFIRTSNTLYSNKDFSDPKLVFTLSAAEKKISTAFIGQDYSYPDNWAINDSTNSKTYIIDNTLYQLADGVTGIATASADSKFYLKGDFDISIEFDLTSYTVYQTNLWEIFFGVIDVNNANNSVKYERTYRDGTNKLMMWIKNNSTTWTNTMSSINTTLKGVLRLVRDGQIFKAYTKGIDEPSSAYSLLGYYQTSSFGIESQVFIRTSSDTTTYPKIQVRWDNFVLAAGEPIYSTSQDARWVKIKMYNGDGVTRSIKRIGIYPDITTKTTLDGKHNCIWEPMGSAVTTYTAEENLALGATLSASSFVGHMTYENLNNGEVASGLLGDCWGAASSDSKPWILLDLGSQQQVYRFKLYHGYSDGDTSNIATDYEIQTSLDNITFTTVFDIAANTLFTRTHDLLYAIEARYVKILIKKFLATNMVVWTGETFGNQYWKGATLREIEVYKYYGYSVVDSESSPIIAVDLKKNYFIEGHTLIGTNTEEVDRDWDNADSNFTYANSTLDDPTKVSFRPWGSSPYYDKWVVVKRNTATSYPTVPTLGKPNTDTPDYLKHVVVTATEDEFGTAPNPVEYPWMWASIFSNISADFSNKMPGGVVRSSLKIDYPASTNMEHVYFIEGDNFGIDGDISWRDGFGLGLYIDNIDNLDLTYGYIYFGGNDYTEEANPIIHKWYFSTISGALGTNWNNLHLSFKDSDTIEYTELTSASVGRDPRRLHTVTLGKMGIVFRGKGSPVSLAIDGCYISRNTFDSVCYKDYGLYLHGREYLKIPLGELDLNSTSLEFWIRPNWTWEGLDTYNDYFNRSLFHLGNTSNDVFGATVSVGGLCIYYGNVLTDFNIFTVNLSDINLLDSTFHMAFVVSNSGRSISSDGSTIRFYLNNVLIAKSLTTWEISDEKHFNFVVGGQSLLAQKSKTVDCNSSAVDGVIGRLKVYNYCKTDFSDFTMGKSYFEDKDTSSIYKPNDFIEISKDNLTFVKVGSAELPFYFPQVPAEESIPIWLKVRLPKDLTGSEKRTANLSVAWDIGV